MEGCYETCRKMTELQYSIFVGSLLWGTSFSLLFNFLHFIIDKQIRLRSVLISLCLSWIIGFIYGKVLFGMGKAKKPKGAWRDS